MMLIAESESRGRGLLYFVIFPKEAAPAALVESAKYRKG